MFPKLTDEEGLLVTAYNTMKAIALRQSIDQDTWSEKSMTREEMIKACEWVKANVPHDLRQRIQETLLELDGNTVSLDPAPAAA